jgi:hypothetical protein
MLLRLGFGRPGGRLYFFLELFLELFFELVFLCLLGFLVAIS